MKKFVYKGREYIPKDITHLIITDDATSIGDYALENCKSLVSVHMGKNIKIIGRAAFWGCSSLKSITLPEGIEKIKDYAFGKCDNLTIYCEAKGLFGRWDLYGWEEGSYYGYAPERPPYNHSEGNEGFDTGNWNSSNRPFHWCKKESSKS